MSSTPPLKLEWAGIDKVIHERARLGIMSMLAAAGELSFVELKEHLGMTDGNLSVHLRSLEEAGYLDLQRDQVDRKPRTTLRITRRGRAAFRDYLDLLERIVRRAKG